MALHSLPLRADVLRRQLQQMFSSLFALALVLAPAAAHAQTTRIPGAIREGERAALAGSQPPSARPQNDIGAVAANTPINGITLVFSRSTEQQAALDALIAAQQNPASPLYHQWLTPAQFGASFGLSDADIAKVQTWLEDEGFSIDSISPSRTAITFSGSAGQVAAAFGTELHHYSVNGETHYAPSADLSIPAALSSAVLAVRNVSTYRARPHILHKAPVAAPATTTGASPEFTSAQSGSHYLTPGDVATIYDVKAAYSAGYTGAGQSIAILGQSAVTLSDISNFQTAAGLTVKLPTTILVPSSGASTLVPEDETESDLDLEYSGAIGKGATIYFVYTGSNTNYGVFDSLQYAVDNKIAPIISLSYGDCEPDLGSTDYASINAILAQAAAQGETFINSSGDSGSTACYGFTGLSTAVQESVAVSYPASSQYALGLGGTEFPAADVASAATNYWTSASGTDVINSALSYIPEMVWNDDSASGGLSSGGGGISTLTARPSWQAGVPGIPSGSFRLVPDISLDSSPNNAGYLYCSSAGYATTGINGSCSNGFRDVNNVYLTLAGGTSFAAPIFAGMLSIIEQRLGGSGLGLVTPTLYTLAANATTYSTAFHDITSGNNECLAGSTYCTSAGAAVYAAGTGYDEATGLGSIDLYNLMNAWATLSTTTSLAATTTTVTATTATPAVGAIDTITITVASASSSVTSVPAGTISLSVDGSIVNSALALANGVATYSFSSTTTGAHVITATFSGSTVYNPSTGSVALSINPAGGIAVTAANLTIADGSSGASTITVTPSGGYTGTVTWNITSSATISNACYTLPSAVVTSTAAVSSALTIYTSETTCAALAQHTIGYRSLGSAPARSAAIASPPSPAPGSHPQRTTEVVFAGLLAGLVLGRRNRRLRTVMSLLLLSTLGIFLAGCGDSSTAGTTTTSTLATKGTYTLTIIGTDSVSSAITASANITLTID